MKTGFFKTGDVTVFDPKHEHHYQPAYTMVGGGVIGNAATAKRKEDTYIIRSQQSMFAKSPETRWVSKGVASFQPELSKIALHDGTTVEYEYLVVAPGCELRFDMIEGAREALDDAASAVASIYTL